ncbi:MAG: DinB family protein [Dehalococcoidia bacterium]
MTAVAAMLDKLRTARAGIMEQLERTSEGDMTTPAPGTQTPTATVRFLFYRLIAHEAEHTVHLVKTLDALGISQSEAQLILRELQGSRGRLEGLLVGLSDEDIDRAPGEGEWSPRRVLEHIIEAEQSYTRRIHEALGAK